MNDPRVVQIDSLLAKIREELLGSSSFEVAELRPEVLAGYSQDVPDGPKFANHASPVLVMTIAVTRTPQDELQRQLSLPPNHC